ncbi:MAG: AmmeMemoRadiSam system protein B [Ignavibacteria bacterium]|nr:AmmeMemoRadiSam system protein B [Ignavibacteria bacterium]
MKVREPAVAGMFYPSSQSKLQNMIMELLNANKVDEHFPNITGLISPHAGYVYSGKTAAVGYNTIADKDYSTVIILSPSHREFFAGISIYDGDAYRTPLGTIPINKEIAAKLTAGSKVIFESSQGHGSEHAVEVQLPFLQMVLKNFSIVPIVIGDQRKACHYELSERLSKVIDDSVLLIASTDLSHFYSRTIAKKLDSVIENHLINFDYEHLQSDLENGKCEACGGGAVVALMKAAELAQKKNIKVLARTDSGDITGDHSEVVGYLSAVVY